jgi:hypothetical protein
MEDREGAARWQSVRFPVGIDGGVPLYLTGDHVVKYGGAIVAISDRRVASEASYARLRGGHGGRGECENN